MLNANLARNSLAFEVEGARAGQKMFVVRRRMGHPGYLAGGTASILRGEQSLRIIFSTPATSQVNFWLQSCEKGKKLDHTFGLSHQEVREKITVEASCYAKKFYFFQPR